MSTRPFVPPTFGGFGKSGLFQVYDKDALEHQVKLVHKSAAKEAVTFEPSVVFAPKQPRGQLKVSLTNRARFLTGVTVDATVQTDASKASSIAVKAKNVAPKLAPGINVTLTETTSEKDFAGKPRYGFFATLAADYARNNASVTASVTTDGDVNHSVSASAAVGFEGFSVGGDVKLVKAGAGAFAPKSYNAGAVYTRGLYTAAVVSDAKFEKLKATLLAKKVNGYALDAGLQAKVDIQAPKAGKPQREVILGLEHKATPSTTYKGAIVLTAPSAVFGVEHKLEGASVSATAVVGKPATLYSAFPVSKYGVAVTIGDI